ncbi:ubiquitin-related domain-containing protein [Chytridium lagenaria]|nr:ubiquitin-related domain-containing protein [Chytridium lagenaria]KAI8851032.1 ubiquitin-related domain-containing protein [Chytridium lagenaria]
MEEKRFVANTLSFLGRKAVKNSLDYEPEPSQLTSLPPASRPFDLKANDAGDEEKITINIKPLKGGKAFKLRLEKLESIDNLKKIIEKEAGIPYNSQRLVLGGKGLLDHKTLPDYDIKDNATIHLMLKAAEKPSESQSASTEAPAPSYDEQLKALATKKDFWASLDTLIQQHIPNKNHRDQLLAEIKTLLKK